jgi:parallel beta-helix repeat protein
LDGISLVWDSVNNIIEGNNISFNEHGIYLNSSSNNSIYHNNLIDNKQNSYNEVNNTWDDGKYGNYWSDYEERYPDAKKKLLKGIWDTPYEIDGGSNKDNCPLIKPWSKSKSIDIPNNNAISSSLLLRFLDHFPLLHRILDIRRHVLL